MKIQRNAPQFSPSIAMTLRRFNGASVLLLQVCRLDG
jgi:hypothetical protein